MEILCHLVVHQSKVKHFHPICNSHYIHELFYSHGQSNQFVFHKSLVLKVYYCLHVPFKQCYCICLHIGVSRQYNSQYLEYCSQHKSNAQEKNPSHLASILVTIRPMAVWLLGANNMALGNLVKLLIISEQFSTITIGVGGRILESRKGGRL